MAKRFPWRSQSGPASEQRRFSSSNKRHQASDLFEYTSGRWMYNDALRHAERRRTFNVPELKRLAAQSVQHREEDVVDLVKLAEGGFNRSFLITLQNGRQLVARIPYPVTEPKALMIASEVATMDFVRSHGIPVPKIFDYSVTEDNAAGTEYIFMEYVQDINLGHIWFTLTWKQREKIVTSLVELESRLFALQFPASGSLFYSRDLADDIPRVPLQQQDPDTGKDFCIGPDMSLGMWYGRRLGLSVDRGPYNDSLSALTAGAKKEIAYLTKYGRPIQPLQRLRRELYDYKEQSHLEHLATLNTFLQAAPHLIPNGNPTLQRPVVRHPDLQPNNVFVTPDLEISSVIDWQHASILPLFLQCGILNSLQNYGDPVSETLQVPAVPNFDDLGEEDQYHEVELFRKRHLHYLYFAKTAALNRTHHEALSYPLSILRRRLFRHASEPWEGDNITLKADLARMSRDWTKLDIYETVPYPKTYSEEESAEYLRLDHAQVEADEQLQTCQDIVGVGSEGWVPLENYNEAKQRERKLKTDALEAVESEEERMRLEQNWIFDDFPEDEYL
ncbi:kinase-like domain-containing protein [Aspergillus pseudodeflectus]|uniref:Kinase-like domain-containing protein n=1 Tax=Aspergillus pseudodeflectus TaxID=176178 RepID=A0ABR4L5P4_9EURO